MRSNIFITGFSGSGKTTVGQEVARRLGWRFVDIDDEIVATAGKPIEAIFEQDGEQRFRELEHQSLAATCSLEEQVVSTGGGIVVEDRNRNLMRQNGAIVCLEALPETVHRRLSQERRESRNPVIRPMLDDPDPLGRIVALKSKRQSEYSQADWTVHTDNLTPLEVANEVVRAWEVLVNRSAPVLSEEANDSATMVRTSSVDYPVWVGWGMLEELGDKVLRILSPGAAYVVTDEGAYRHGRRAQVSLEAAGIPSHIFVVPSGETSKSLQTAQQIYGWLAERRAERGHLLIAVGGGVVGDLGGYVAATYLRGIKFAQVPTTLLGMMDASVGGKTGVDLPHGKNLVGAFYQPRFVLQDVQTLQTLPDRELAAGWVEAIKHGLIMDEGLLRTFEEERDAILSLDREVSTDVIRRSVAIKADVVSRDDKETLGIRVLLNYGHTIGHAIEAATGYERFVHGEAVSIGIVGAGRIARGLGMLSDQEVERQRTVLEAYGLPVAWNDLDVDTVNEAMSLDKKKSRGAIRWVLLNGIGHAISRDDVPSELVDQALLALRG